jgi:hypothetical protein
MTRESNWKGVHSARQPRRSGLEFSLLAYGTVGLALVLAVAVMMTISGPPDFPAGAVPP